MSNKQSVLIGLTSFLITAIAMMSEQWLGARLFG